MLKNSKLSTVSPVSYVYFTLFFISGVSGLIYESIWSQYLKQFLGHAAYAQTLVLVIYMGGMALGAWITSILAVRIRNLLFGYAAVEIALGIAALYFHDVFIAYLGVSFTTVIPLLNDPLPITCYKWVSASLIILPQSMLLGATFPLMAGGILRRFPGLSGYKTSVIYFVNTFGASVGVLVSGFYFVKEWGLEGAIIAGGMIDLFVGISILALWFCDRRAQKEEMAEGAAGVNAAAAVDTDDDAFDIDDIALDTGATGNTAGAGGPMPVLSIGPADRREFYYPLLGIACLTATASFIYEIGWIRMLSLVLGSSTHSFELMLSAFILGLALGSFFVRNRLDRIKNAPMFLGAVQIIMGATAIFTLFTYGNMFQFMVFTMDALDTTSGGYVLFNIISHLICMLVMLPSTICAGMVIPLIIHMLYRRGYGEQTIGKVYAVNTAGGIIGVVLAVWVLMELVGLKYLIIIGGVIDMAIGLYVFRHFRETRESLMRTFALPACLAVLIAALAFGNLDPVLAASGVFRYGTVSKTKNVVAHVDGKTASISLFRSGDYLVLSTNGKPDASVGTTEEHSTDEHTMSLLGVLPLSVQEARTAAVIGMGAGMTAHYMLYDPAIELLDVIEIERGMVKLAKKIGPKVENVFNDPRSHIHIEDAKTFFSARNRSYDVIVSEPSNPWVSGVSSLFSKEFFKLIRNHINDGGLLVQWFHTYEADITIFVSILKALGESFPAYEIYAAGSDLIIIAAKDPGTDISIKRDVFHIGQMAQSLASMGFEGIDDFKLLRIYDKEFLDPFINTYNTPPNSDYHSYVDLYAVKHRFAGSRVFELEQIREFVIPVRRIVSADTGYLSLSPNRALPNISNMADVQVAKILSHEIALSAIIDTVTHQALSAPIFILDYAHIRPERITFAQIHSAVVQILQSTLPHLSAEEMREIWEIIEKKVSKKPFSESEENWMTYFRSLCYYDLPEMRRLSMELLPQDSISNHASNQMLLASMLASSAALGDTSGVDRIWNRYSERKRPPFPLRAAKALLLDPNRRE